MRLSARNPIEREKPGCDPPRAQLVKKVFLTSWWTGGALLPRHYHPLQISLAPLCSTSEICKEAIFALGNGISRRKNQHPRPTYTPSGAIYMREGFGPLALSRVFDKLASGAIRPGLLFFSQRRICP